MCNMINNRNTIDAPKIIVHQGDCCTLEIIKFGGLCSKNSFLMQLFVTGKMTSIDFLR